MVIYLIPLKIKWANNHRNTEYGGCTMNLEIFAATVNKEDYAADFTIKDTMSNASCVGADEWREKPVRHLHIHGGFNKPPQDSLFIFLLKRNSTGIFFNTSHHFLYGVMCVDRVIPDIPFGHDCEFIIHRLR